MSILELFQRKSAPVIPPEPTLDEREFDALSRLKTAETKLKELEDGLTAHGTGSDLATFQIMEAAVRRQSMVCDEIRAEYTELERQLGEFRFQEAIRLQKEQNRHKRQLLLSDLEAKERELAGLLEYHRIPFEIRYSQAQSERSAILAQLGSLPNE